MIALTVNGQKREVDAPADKPLLWVLREDLNIVGPKFGCGIAACGACTVLIDGKPVNSCLVATCQVDGAHVRTVEGLASSAKLSKLQKAFLEHGAAQCGICTPGMATTPGSSRRTR